MLMVLVWLGCESCEEAPPPEVPITLAEASEEVTFASTEAIGTHTFLATTSREEHRRNRVTSSHEEVVEIHWQDWDNFRYRRLVDEQTVSESAVIEGVAYTRKGGAWKKRGDAETYRMQLRTTWNIWDQTLKVFGERVVMEEVGTDTIEGRPARRFSLSLGPESPRRSKATQQEQPLTLSGTFWVDEATAVRLTGELEGELGREGYRRAVTLKLARTNIGEPQQIRPSDL